MISDLWNLKYDINVIYVYVVSLAPEPGIETMAPTMEES